jgi:hypothetical protein
MTMRRVVGLVVTLVGVMAFVAHGARAEYVQTAVSQKECIADALKPVGAYAEIENAGVSKDQGVYVQVHNIALPTNCESEFEVVREERAEVLVQDPIDRTHWVPFSWVTLNNDRSGHIIGYVDKGNLGGAYFTKFDQGFSENVITGAIYEPGLYECTPGPRKTGVKMRFEQLAVAPQAEVVMGSKIFTRKVTRIDRKC